MLPYVFLCEGYRCWSCICVLGVSMLIMYLRVRGVDVGHVFAGYGYRSWSCICVLVVSIVVVYLCASGIDVGHVCVC
jgi:uncharacterized membrane protein (DUF441 family)